LTFENQPSDLQEVVDAQRKNGQPIERIYKRLHKFVEDPDLRPGITLAALAAIEGFQLFISTTFDSLLPRAVESLPGGLSSAGAQFLAGALPRFAFGALEDARPRPALCLSDPWPCSTLPGLCHLG
jgi:hypothetical protein